MTESMNYRINDSLNRSLMHSRTHFVVYWLSRRSWGHFISSLSSSQNL